MTAHGFDTAGIDHCPFMPVFGAPAISIERGRGTEVWATDGTRYLDFLSGIAVVSLGHANPVIADAIARQASTLLHVSNFFTNPQATAAAVKTNELLLDATGQAGQIFFTNSGAEANECAIKLARRFGGRGRHTVVSALGSFHGRTLATLAATGQPAKHEPFAPMPEGFRHVPWGDLDALRAAVDGSVAAVLIEPIQGEGGVIPAPDGYLRAIRELCDEVGALMMVDEIQTGFARTGTWFGFEHAGVAPDVVTLAKAIGNGMPIGACWARREIAAVFRPGDHGSTYSGTAIATAAVSAVVDEMRRIDAPGLARARGAELTALLSAIRGVESVRGAGLLLGAQLAPGLDAPAAYQALLAHGLICNAVNATTLRLAPPLTTTTEQLHEAAALVSDVLAAMLVETPVETASGAAS
jgi:acetylornithine/N-succinyldiaminopimelate aminotransferase